MGKQKTKLDDEGPIKEKKSKYDDLIELWKAQKPMPEVYTVPPEQPQEKKVGQLTPEQLKQFFEKGYVCVPNFFPSNRLEVVRESVTALVDGLANKLYNAGKIKNKHGDKGFLDRLVHLNKEFKGAAVLLFKHGGIMPKEIQDLWSDERLLNAVEQLIGPDIAGHPVWNLRGKTPRTEQTTVPWHQDNAYLHPCALETLQPVAWIPLVNANKVNGCMQFVSGGHRKGKTATHTCCAGGTWYVQLDEEDMVNELDVNMDKDVVTCEVPYGGVVFLQNCVPHRSLENLSDVTRWSLDLRWQNPNMDNGFYGLQDSVLMRTSKDTNYKIDWSGMAKFNRTKKQMIHTEDNEEDEFSTEISGPWMKRWKIVHHNEHTLHFQRINNLDKP